MKVTGIECPKCKDQIWSRHRHDCRSCKCGYCYIDGGRDYLRVGYGAGGAPNEDLPIPQTVEITIK